MAGRHGDQDDPVGWFEFADAVDDGHVQYIPAFQRLVCDVPQDVFRHFRIMFQLHGQDSFPVMDIPHGAEKRDDGADVVPSGTQAAELKKESQAGKLTAEKIEKTVAPTKREENPELKVTFTNDELRPYFPKKDTTVGDVKRVVFESLTLRQKAMERQQAKAAPDNKKQRSKPDLAIVK